MRVSPIRNVKVHACDIFYSNLIKVAQKVSRKDGISSTFTATNISRVRDRFEMKLNSGTMKYLGNSRSRQLDYGHQQTNHLI